MVTNTRDVTEQGEWTQTMAAAAKLMEMTAGQPTLGTEQIDEYLEMFSWIPTRFNEFNHPAPYEFAGLVEGFGRMAVDDFGAPETNEDGVPTQFIHDKYPELDRLSRIINEESHGAAFDSFAENVLLRLDTMWQNQGLIAEILSITAQVECNIYDRARADLIKLGKKAVQRFEWICARERGDGANFENEATIFSTGSLVIGLAGLIPGLGTVATLTSAAIGLYSMSASDEVLEDPGGDVEGGDGTKYTITGETTEDVASSLRSAIQELVSTIREAEENLKSVIDGISDLLADPTERAFVVAPGGDFPE